MTLVRITTNAGTTLEILDQVASITAIKEAFHLPGAPVVPISLDRLLFSAHPGPSTAKTTFNAGFIDTGKPFVQPKFNVKFSDPGETITEPIFDAKVVDPGETLAESMFDAKFTDPGGSQSLDVYEKLQSLTTTVITTQARSEILETQLREANLEIATLLTGYGNQPIDPCENT